MIRVLALMVCLVFLFTGCSSVDVYTFKKDRVDQKVDGNQGFLEGQAEKSQTSAEKNKKRTLIGVDIGVETYGTLDEGDTSNTTKTAAAPEPVTNIEPKNTAPKQAETVVEVVEAREEEWIK